MALNLVPKKLFLTNGVGVHREKLQSFELALRDAGIEPVTLLALLARLGTSDPVEPVTHPAPLIASIDFARFGRAPARFDEAELALLNARIVHQLDYATVADRLPPSIDAAAWHAIRPNISTVAQAAEWAPLFAADFAPPRADAADADLLVAAAALMPTLDGNADPWHALTAQLKATSGRKGRALFLPLRLALTGRDHGPDMAEVLPLIGAGEARRRLIAATG